MTKHQDYGPCEKCPGRMWGNGCTKNGTHRIRCNLCNHSRSENTHIGFRWHMTKLTATGFYLMGFSARECADIVGASHTAVKEWLILFAPDLEGRQRRDPPKKEMVTPNHPFILSYEMMTVKLQTDKILMIVPGDLRQSYLLIAGDDEPEE